MPATDQKTDRQDITDLKPRAIYESPLSRRRVRASLLKESSMGLFINTMRHRSAAASPHSLWDLLWLQGFAALTSSPGSAKHKRKTTNNNMAQRRWDAHKPTVLWTLHDRRNMSFWKQRQLLSVNEPCCLAAEQTGPAVWQRVIINRRGDKSLAEIPSVLRTALDNAAFVFHADIQLLHVFPSKMVESGWNRAGLTLVSCSPVVRYDLVWWRRCGPSSLRGVLIEEEIGLIIC